MAHPDYLTIAGFLACAVAAVFVTVWVQKAWRGWRLSRRFRHAREGECEARTFLERHGFRLLGEQVEIHPSMWVDGEQVEFTVRVDYLVEKQGRRAVVEVKTGSHATDPAASATRRQLLEYARCYDVDDVYLYDAEQGVLRLVRFSSLPVIRRSSRAWLLWLIAGLVCGAGAALLILFAR